MTEEAPLQVDRDGGIMTLTMNRPKTRNALSPRMPVELAGKLSANGPLVVQKIEEGALRSSA